VKIKTNFYRRDAEPANNVFSLKTKFGPM